MEGTSPLRLHVASDSPELSAIHEAAQPRAMFYITIILTMYLFGLILIFIHYMNSSYGKWAWTLSDAWDELTPAFFNQRCVKTFRRVRFSIFIIFGHMTKKYNHLSLTFKSK